MFIMAPGKIHFPRPVQFFPFNKDTFSNSERQLPSLLIFLSFALTNAGDASQLVPVMYSRPSSSAACRQRSWRPLSESLHSGCRFQSGPRSPPGSQKASHPWNLFKNCHILPWKQLVRVLQCLSTLCVPWFLKLQRAVAQSSVCAPFFHVVQQSTPSLCAGSCSAVHVWGSGHIDRHDVSSLRVVPRKPRKHNDRWESKSSDILINNLPEPTVRVNMLLRGDDAGSGAGSRSHDRHG